MDKVLRQNAKWLVMLKGLLFAYIITAFIILLLSFLMLKVDLPAMVFSGGTNLTYIISAFAAGFFIGKKMEEKKFIWGLVMGVLYFIILLLVSLALNNASVLPMGSYFTTFIICSLSGMLGGMIS